jgi:hypothetical protein
MSANQPTSRDVQEFLDLAHEVLEFNGSVVARRGSLNEWVDKDSSAVDPNHGVDAELNTAVLQDRARQFGLELETVNQAGFQDLLEHRSPTERRTIQVTAVNPRAFAQVLRIAIDEAKRDATDGPRSNVTISQLRRTVLGLNLTTSYAESQINELIEKRADRKLIQELSSDALNMAERLDEIRANVRDASVLRGLITASHPAEFVIAHKVELYSDLDPKRPHLGAEILDAGSNRIPGDDLKELEGALLSVAVQGDGQSFLSEIAQRTAERIVCLEPNYGTHDEPALGAIANPEYAKALFSLTATVEAVDPGSISRARSALQNGQLGTDKSFDIE